ncbi:MAG: GNAT family N-acetyltransferase [Planctomycetota bacterium]
MAYELKPINSSDQQAVIDIFNYYVENGFAAFPDKPLPVEAFDHFMNQAQGHPTLSAKDSSGAVVGFCLLRPHNPQSAFSTTAEITTFIHPDHTGKGLGAQMIETILQQAREKGLKCILASISSLNEPSIRFHETHGFIQCGCFKQAAQKNGQFFDTVWMQKLLD